MPGAEASLIERAVEVDVLDTAVARLGAGEGSVVVLEAPAGLGKTVLLEHAEEHATAAACRVRRAAPGPLERHFPFGVVRALLEAPLRDASERERARLLDGAAEPAGALLLDGTVPGGDATMLIAHSVLWLCSAMADEQPLALVVDDAHWADRPSLEVLSYLARRIDDLPLLIALAARSGRPRCGVGPAQPARRRALGDRPAPAAAELAGRGRADPPRRARHADRGLSRPLTGPWWVIRGCSAS